MNFLHYLKEASSSTLAFVGYILVIVAFSIRYFLIYKNRQLAKILNGFGSDKEKIKAIKSLTGSEPPTNIRKEEILLWAKESYRHKAKLISLAGYIVTMTTVIIIIAMASFRSQQKSQNEKPPLEKPTIDTTQKNSLKHSEDGVNLNNSTRKTFFITSPVFKSEFQNEFAHDLNYTLSTSPTYRLVFSHDKNRIIRTTENLNSVSPGNFITVYVNDMPIYTITSEEITPIASMSIQQLQIYLDSEITRIVELHKAEIIPHIKKAIE